MSQPVKLSEHLQSKLICPHGKTRLLLDNAQFRSDADLSYPVIDGIPILINDDNSVFSIADFEARKDTTFELEGSKVKEIYNNLVPSITLNLKSKDNYAALAELLPDNARVLIVGGSIRGEGMDAIFSKSNVDIVSSDVSFGPYTDMVCDAHDIPFEDGTFDCVVVQAVLEHVVDPYQCVAEVHRVMKDGGLVYAETPFMQQVHMHEYDFTRFTHLGHRRVFRHFEEVDSGPIGGPGMALAWSWVYLFRCFSTKPWLSRFFSLFAHVTSFFWKYLDHLVIDTPGAYDAASGFYFLGTKSGTLLSDRDLLKQFKGIP